MESVINRDLETALRDAQGPVLVDFWAPWCRPCRLLERPLAEVGSELSGKLAIIKVNVDENPDFARRHGIHSIPTLIVFKAGQPVDTVVGPMSKPQLLRWLEGHL